MLHQRVRLCLTVLFLVCCLPLAPQAGGNSGGGALPTNPREFLALAAAKNGLAAENIGPWHVKATFELLDAKGKSHEAGTFESFWKSQVKYKMVYTSPSYSRTIWANESGTFATTDLRWPGEIEWMVRRSLFDVSPEPDRFHNANPEWRDAAGGSVKLKCIDAVPVYARLVPYYCFDSAAAVIRFVSEVGEFYQAGFNEIVLFNGAYVARDVKLFHAKSPYFHIHLDTLEPLPESAEDMFRADPAALPIVRRVVIDTDLREIDTKHQVGMRHSYPAISAAPSARSGLNSPFSNPSLSNETAGDREVIIQVLVNTKGKVTDARAVKGAPYLQVAGATAAWKWEFKPYLVEGQPTEFYTELEFF